MSQTWNPPVEISTTAETNSYPHPDLRIIDWISSELDRCQDGAGRVSREDAGRIALTAGKRVIRAMGGL